MLSFPRLLRERELINMEGKGGVGIVGRYGQEGKNKR